MKILMLGNSFTYVNDVPAMLGKILGVSVQSHTRGGARLSEHLNPETELGSRTLPALQNEKWDYVVLQEQSFAPIGTKQAFLDSVRKLCRLIREAGAKPILYATWGYREGSEKLASTGITFDEMTRGLHDSYHQAAEENDALVADVGLAFASMRELAELYDPDDYHPSQSGSILAAETIARVIEADRR